MQWNGVIVGVTGLVAAAGGLLGVSILRPSPGAAQPEKPAPPAPSAPVQPQPASPSPSSPPLDWKTLEAPLLTRHVQLTLRDKFVRAGEQYFSPDSRWMIFQAVAVPPEGQEPDPFYAMYVARIVRDGAGHVTGLEEPIKISPPDSANTCGWFHPVAPFRVLFGSTLVHPKNDQKAGFSVRDRSYKWMFPEEMEIVEREVPEIYTDDLAQLTKADAGAGAPVHREARREFAVVPAPVFTRPNYDAECSYSHDGRFILYAHVRDQKTADRPDADIWVYDTVTREQHPLVVADGYDGGPFFSPDEKMICYRSDRSLDDLLQLFVAELVYNSRGVPVAVRNERQLTANGEVNWAPFWHPNGKLLVYGNSGLNHQNYEVYAVEVAPGGSGAAPRTHRVTWADGADVLPVFSRDGKLMAWTSQRGPKIEGEAKASSQIWVAECVEDGFDSPDKMFGTH